MSLAKRERRARDVVWKASAAAPIDEEVHKGLESVRERVASGIAIRAVKAAELVDGAKIGVALMLCRDDNQLLLNHVVAKIKQTLLSQEFLFAVAPGPPHGSHFPVVIVASSPRLLEKAAILACAKFLGRVKESHTEPERWTGYIADICSSDLDEAMLWEIVRKTSHVLNPKTPPRGARPISSILAAARARLDRLTPAQALHELHDLTYPLPVVLVDIRSAAQHKEYGTIPDSLVVDRGALEWQFDPRSDTRLSVADRFDLRIIVIDHEGLASSLAAASLHDLGLLNATDVVGGFAAWKEAGLPTHAFSSYSML